MDDDALDAPGTSMVKSVGVIDDQYPANSALFEQEKSKSDAPAAAAHVNREDNLDIIS